MNMREITDEFDSLCRTAGIGDYATYRCVWINRGYRVLCSVFDTPALKITETVLSVAGQDTYCFPYPYDMREVVIKYDNHRLDPVPEHVMELVDDRRSGYRGPVDYYDNAGILGADGLVVLDAVITNRSAVVTSAGGNFTAAGAAAGFWLRFDPWTTGTTTYNPGDYGCAIGTYNNTGQITLAEVYRGPAGTTTCRIRPKETRTFRLFGTPRSSGKSIEQRVYRKPRRLYNDEDVPEEPGLSDAIADMAISVGMEHLGRSDDARSWEMRAVEKLRHMERRRESQALLTPDMPRSRISRRTGVPSIYSRRYGGFR